jgi:hypothetical protein
VLVAEIPRVVIRFDVPITEGTYTLGPLNSFGFPIGSKGITRSPSARWWLTNESEWYKAAYHKNDGVTGNYWRYPTSTDATPFSDQPPGTDAPTQSNTANFFRFDPNINDSGYDDGYAAFDPAPFDNSQNYLTDAGAYTLSVSPYGTYDQRGQCIRVERDIVRRGNSRFSRWFVVRQQHQPEESDESR